MCFDSKLCKIKLIEGKEETYDLLQQLSCLNQKPYQDYS